jgi:tRNA(Ile)-lysidine synthase TilS/MesJ
MQCDVCRNEAIISQQYSGRRMCHRHFVADLETKAKRSIRAHHWLSSGDHIGVRVAADKQSWALLYFMKKLTQNRRDIHLSVIPDDGEITECGSRLSAERIAALLGLPCILSVSGDYGAIPEEETEKFQGAGTLRHHPHDKGNGPAARITKIAVAFNLEDMARGILIRFLRGNLDTLVHPSTPQQGSLPVICPFGSIPSAELELYWDCEGTGLPHPPYIPARHVFEDRVAGLLDGYNTRHPATHHALLHIGEQLANGDVASMVVNRGEDGSYGISRCGMCGFSMEGKGNGA